MSNTFQNIIPSLTVLIKRDHLSFKHAGKVFFGFLFFLAFGIKVQGQTATTINSYSRRKLRNR
jgi:hypothetical protein